MNFNPHMVNISCTNFGHRQPPDQSRRDELHVRNFHSARAACQIREARVVDIRFFNSVLGCLLQILLKLGREQLRVLLQMLFELGGISFGASMW